VFYRFYRDKLLVGDVKPNSAHLRLAALERERKVKAVITQNIDGLHQAAGSKVVLELHGSTHRYFCTRCKRAIPERVVVEGTGVPYCSCGGRIRPDVVLYEEALDEAILRKAVYFLRNADMLIVGGTSLAVYPAAGLLDYYHGNKLVLINKTSTPLDQSANLLIPENIGAVFAQV
jgi:NAD-dependent deacetylase